LAGQAALAVVLMAVGLAGAGTGERQPPMTGLYNIVLAPFTGSGPGDANPAIHALEPVLAEELRKWAGGDSTIQLRGPDEVDQVTPIEGAARDHQLEALARHHNADVVVTGSVRLSDGTPVTAIEFFIADRTLDETPEFTGRHEISVAEPLDVLNGNVALNEELALAALNYLKGVVAFVRGLGHYAMDDFAAAEGDFLAANEVFALVDRLQGTQKTRREVLYLMLGNTVGRRDKVRLGEAAEYYRLALAANPAYARAEIGLAEVARGGATCEASGRTTTRTALLDAVDHYRAAIEVSRRGGRDPQPLMEMRARVGLGVTYQCLAMATVPPPEGPAARGVGGDRWAEADAEFRQVLLLRAGVPAAGGGARQALRLAAEARAGQALTAFLTAGTPSDDRFGGLPAAAAAYEEALGLLGRIDVVRRTNLQREQVLLRNLRRVYEAMAERDLVADVDDRITVVDERLAVIGRQDALRR
jgi:hypothetical protein